MNRTLPWLALVCAALAIASAPWAWHQAWLSFVFKPATTLLIIAWAWPRGRRSPERRWILAGLWLSLAGDVALLWPQSGFLPGLVSFLLAHLAYLVAFTRSARLLAWAPPALAYAAVAALVLARLWPGVPSALQAPVLAYVAALATMAAQAASRWRTLARASAEAGRLAVRAAAGGALFMLSDALLATERFAGPLPAAGLWILASYWLAQGLIAAALPAAETPAVTSP